MYQNSIKRLLKDSLTCLKTFERYTSIQINKPIKGVFPPICTPFEATKNENISWKHLKSNLEQWENVDFSGYVIHGSNGEYPYLTDNERLELIKFVKQLVSKDKMIIAGAGYECKLSDSKSKTLAILQNL